MEEEEMPDYGLKIKRQDVTKDVEDCEVKELVFHSSYACAKILQDAKVSATSGSEQEVSLVSTVSFPIIVLCYVYNSATSKYSPVNVEFDLTKVYLPGLGLNAGSYFYLFVCYA
jgi:hypothetical protein